MSITIDALVGYTKAEFAKASRWRLVLLIVQFLAAIPAALSVVVTDEKLLYGLAIIGPAPRRDRWPALPSPSRFPVWGDPRPRRVSRLNQGGSPGGRSGWRRPPPPRAARGWS